MHGALNHFMLGTSEMLESSMLEQSDSNFIKDNGSYLFVSKDDVENKNNTVRQVKTKDLDPFMNANIMIPNILYSPEAIFSNRIGSLDINFLHPNTYTGVAQNEGEVTKESGNTEYGNNQYGRQYSAASKLSKTISSWYRAFRNIAIVGLLSVLVYIGIRILIGSTAQDRAKYKERLQDWLVALCLVFITNFIMTIVLVVTEQITNLFEKEPNNIIVQLVNESGDVEKVGQSQGFRTNLIGYARFMIQSSEWSNVVAYTIIYLALIIYTIMFTFIYFKRFLFMAFFTMVSPLVALTYPIDKLGDGKARAFNFWFKEYIMNAILQPIHLILYSVFVGSAIDLAIDNPIYAIVAIGALLPAEKLIKKMFGLDRTETSSNVGALAGGALTMQGIDSIRARLSGGKGNLLKGGNGESNGNVAVLSSRQKSLRYNNDLLSTILGGGALASGGVVIANETNGNNIIGNPNNLKESQQVVTQRGETVEEEIARKRNEELAKFRESAQNKHLNNADVLRRENYLNSQEWADKQRRVIEKRRAKEARQSLIRQRLQVTGGVESLVDQKRKQIKNTPQKLGTGLGNGIRYVGDSVPRLAADAKSGVAAKRIEKGARMAHGRPNGGNAVSPELVENSGGASGNDNNYDFLTNNVGMSSKEAEDFLNGDAQLFVNAGIIDINLMYNAYQLAKEKGYDKQGMLARAELSKSLSDGFNTNASEQRDFRKSIMSKDSRITKDIALSLQSDMIKLKKKN